MPPKLKKESLVDQVYRRLREEIVTMKMPLGSHVNVNELQAVLGVSCTPIREAVNRLQQEGLITYENNVGAAVLTLEPHDVQEIQELSLTLHKEAVRLAMEREDPQVLALEIGEQIERYNRAETAQDEVQAVHRLVGVFYHHCGNRRLDRSMTALQGQQLLLRQLHCGWRGHRKYDGDFREMLRGVEERDVEAICAALEANVRRSDPEILAHLKELTKKQRRDPSKFMTGF